MRTNQKKHKESTNGVKVVEFFFPGKFSMVQKGGAFGKEHVFTFGPAVTNLMDV